MNAPVDRRTFVKKALIAGAGVSFASPLVSWVRADEGGQSAGASRPASNRVRLAVVGTNSRGLAHIEALGGIDNVDVVYVCDVEDGALAKGVEAARKANFASAKPLKDFRVALGDRSIDAITIATPDHWHAPMAILALSAGKHVYLEKPCSHNPREGELLLTAIARHRRLVQMGNQRRSFPNMREIIPQIQQGLIGNAYFARCWYNNHRPSIGHGSRVPVPATLDFELWQGPAPRRPYTSNLVHYNWHWFWHWGTGEALNNGTHEFDVCRWALGVKFPTKVSSTGGRFAFQDDWETPDTQVIGWEYGANKAIAWEGRSCNSFPTERLDRGAIVYGTNGSVLLEGDNYTVFDSNNKIVRQVNAAAEAAGTNTLSASGIRLDRLHVANFIQAIRGDAQLTSPISEGHVSVASLQLGNIAQRVGRTLHCDPATGHVQHDRDAMKLWSREYARGWEPKV